MNSSEAETGKRKMSAAAMAAVAIALALIVYLGFFAAIVVDELVTRTHYITSAMPSGFEDALKVIYYPLIEAVKWLIE